MGQHYSPIYYRPIMSKLWLLVFAGATAMLTASMSPDQDSMTQQTSSNQLQTDSLQQRRAFTFEALAAARTGSSNQAQLATSFNKAPKQSHASIRRRPKATDIALLRKLHGATYQRHQDHGNAGDQVAGSTPVNSASVQAAKMVYQPKLWPRHLHGAPNGTCTACIGSLCKLPCSQSASRANASGTSEYFMFQNLY